VCVQRGLFPSDEQVRGQEDCLYLNVYTPRVSCSLGPAHSEGPHLQRALVIPSGLSKAFSAYFTYSGNREEAYEVALLSVRPSSPHSLGLREYLGAFLGVLCSSYKRVICTATGTRCCWH
jgi:hypothetical protein